jgi:hypothetical protein
MAISTQSLEDSTTKIDLVSMPLIVGESAIYPSTKVHNLGVILDSHLTVEAQISNIRRMAF